MGINLSKIWRKSGCSLMITDCYIIYTQIHMNQSPEQPDKGRRHIVQNL